MLNKSEFHNVYLKNIMPMLMPFELKRSRYAFVDKIYSNFIKFGLILILLLLFFSPLILFVVGVGALFLFMYLSSVLNITGFDFEKMFEFLKMVIPVFCLILFLLVVIVGYIYSKTYNAIRADIKKNLIAKIFAILGVNLFDPKDTQDAISISDMNLIGLSNIIKSKEEDDVITGVYKGLKFVINESYITVKERKNEIKLLIIKFEMNKNFKGRTVAFSNKFTSNMRGLEKVNIEDIDFCKDYNIYSTDQIEARYLLTTAFIERLKAAQDLFNDKLFNNNLHYKYYLDSYSPNGFAFYDNHLYIYLAVEKNLFEVSFSESLYIEEKYYDIYLQLESILSIVDVLKMDKNLGL